MAARLTKSETLGISREMRMSTRAGGYTTSSTGAVIATMRSSPRLDTTALKTQMTTTNTL